MFPLPTRWKEIEISEGGPDTVQENLLLPGVWLYIVQALHRTPEVRWKLHLSNKRAELAVGSVNWPKTNKAQEPASKPQQPRRRGQKGQRKVIYASIIIHRRRGAPSPGASRDVPERRRRKSGWTGPGATHASFSPHVNLLGNADWGRAFESAHCGNCDILDNA